MSFLIDGLSPPIRFCPECERRIGPVSATHSGCGGAESRCTCDPVIVAPTTFVTPPTTPTSVNATSSSPVIIPAGERLLTPAKGAALAVRRWAKTFKSNLNLTFPACVADLTHLDPVEIYTTLKLNQCDEYYNSISAEVGMMISKREADINYCCNRDLLKYKGAKFPTFFDANPRNHLTTTHKERMLNNSRCWFLLDTVEKYEIMEAEANAKYDRLIQIRREKAMSTFRKMCLRIIEGGLSALKAHWRLNTKQNTVRQLMEDQQRAIKRRKMQVQTEEMFDGVDFNEFIAFDEV